ncbi:MAG: hypothetical protein WBS24_06145 [Terriglobales bacterium]
MGSRLVPVLIAAGVLAVLESSAGGQMRGSFGASSHGGSGAHFGGLHFGRSFSNRRGAGQLGGYFGDYPLFYDDYQPDQSTQNSGQPFYVLQPSAAAPASPKPSPLLIELEGDRYVRYGGMTSNEPIADAGSSGARSTGASSSILSRTSSSRTSSSRTPLKDSQAAKVSSVPLAPTVLIYRDGRREQISEYAIVGRTLYAPNSIDTGSDAERNDASRAAEPAYGLRNIQLSALDISATMKVNRENGVNFVLPAAANEVVTRP